ncbi:MAG TPA: MarR family transcriptional regulator [Bryobacteraceae bacterium]
MPHDRRDAYYHERIQEFGPCYANFNPLLAQLALNFVYTSEVFQQATGRYMAPFGLSKSTFNVLMLLRHGPEGGMQLHELGELLLVSRANITGLVDHLEREGCVNRAIDSADRRVRRANITKKGKALLDEFIPVHFGNLKILLQDLSGEEEKVLLGLLRKMRVSVAAHAEACGAARSPAYRTDQE